ncbi:MAG: cobalamin-binding protein [Phycisphaerae bacterium]
MGRISAATQCGTGFQPVRFQPVHARVTNLCHTIGLVLALAFPATLRAGADGSGATTPAPNRIITIAPNSAEIICALGACDRIIGVTKFCVYPPELQKRSRVGGLFDPDLEKIVALRPDFIVLRGRSESVERLCRERKIAIYYDKTDTLTDVETCITELGQLLGLTGEAAKLAERFRNRLDAIKKRTADRPRPRVLLTVSRQPDRLANLLTAGRGTFLDEMLKIAGGTNVFGRLDMMYPQVSAEGIIAQRPDVIIELMPEVKLTPALKKQMLDQWQRLGSIPAVAQDRIHFLTDDYCLIPSPRYVEIIEKVSRILHPEAQVDP